MLKTSSS